MYLKKYSNPQNQVSVMYGIFPKLPIHYKTGFVSSWRGSNWVAFFHFILSLYDVWKAEYNKNFNSFSKLATKTIYEN